MKESRKNGKESAGDKKKNIKTQNDQSWKKMVVRKLAAKSKLSIMLINILWKQQVLFTAAQKREN